MKSVGQIFIFSILKSFTAIVFPIASLFPTIAHAQFREDFSDGEISSNPVWNGSTDHFSVQDGLLKLQAPSGVTTSYLSCQPGNLQLHTWEISVHMSFNPSSSNLTRVYLYSDNPDFSATLNGYYVAIGSSSDDIALYYQKGATRTKLIDGADGRVDLNSVEVRIRITRSPDGEWKLYSDVGHTRTFIEEGASQHNEMNRGQYFGIQCIYTSTRADKFFFDDIAIDGQVIVDTTPPAILDIATPSDKTIKITFSEAIDQSGLNNVASYSVSNDIGAPVSVVSESSFVVTLNFSNSFVANLDYNISLSGIKDLAGNLLTGSVYAFRYVRRGEANQKDVVFTELFPDPSPVVGLPDAEFVEIFNRSDAEFDLSGWILTDGSSRATITNLLLRPNEYAILTAKGNEDKFDAAKVIGLSSFPSLNNSTDMLKLSSANEQMIDSIVYSDTWYHHSEKEDGGWTLEKIDPDNTCSDEENWTASESPMGGTPGALNAVDAENPDLSAPFIWSVSAIAPDTIRILMNEKLEKSLPDLKSFTIAEKISVDHITLSADLRQLKLNVSPSMTTGVLYMLSINGLYDCAGNKATFNNIEVALPEEPDSLDVVINEVLFNPRPDGSDFVELFNRSDKFIDITKLKLANVEEDKFTNVKYVLGIYPLLKPGAIVAISSNVENIKINYPNSTDNLHQSIIPSMNDDEGSIALLNSNGKLIDAVHYYAGMHSAFLREEEGVSLERISPHAPSYRWQNWKSASSLSGYATPGQKNSNTLHEANGDGVSIIPEIFVPRFGQPDFTTISFKLDQPGYIANIRVIDSRGILIKTIAHNELLGNDSFLRWDGERDDGTPARVGAYMVAIELFNDLGNVRTIRKRVVIAAR